MLQALHTILANKCEPAQKTIRWLQESVNNEWQLFVTTLETDTIRVQMSRSRSGVRQQDVPLTTVAIVTEDLVETNHPEIVKKFLDQLRLCECASGLYAQTATVGQKLPCECSSFWIGLENFLERQRFDPVLGEQPAPDDESMVPPTRFDESWVLLIEAELRDLIKDRLRCD